MQCNKCKDYKPESGSGFTHYVCLACGQAWSVWRTGNDKVWYENGVFDLKTMDKIPEALND